MNILAVGAHPDDIEFGCAPVLIQEIERGHRVKMLVLSRGEAGSSGAPEERERESRAAAKLMGAEIEFLDFGGDCNIEYCPSNALRLATEIRKERPGVVLAPNPEENQHPDHSIVGRLVRDACRLARYGGLLKELAPHSVGALLFYNITLHSGRPDLIVDVTGAVEKWEAVMRCHATQLRAKGYFELQMSAARVLGLSAGVEYGIGLISNDPIRVDGIASAVAARSF
jgi:N-acetylglucosamine malate deacetylase 1